MHSVLFLLGFVVGLGGALILLAAAVSAVGTSLAWLNSLIASERATVKDHRGRAPAARARHG
jgi:hypothetical protein